MAEAALRVLLVGPLPPPAGGMANQTAQLARLLAQEACAVTIVQTNAAYRPRWVSRVPVLRAFVRLLPYAARLWRASGAVDVAHVMANSGWAWHLFAAPAIWIGSLRGIPVVVNYRGGEAQAFLRRSARCVRPTLRRAAALLVPSGFLREVFAQSGITAEVLPNVVDLARFAPTPARRPPDAGVHLIITRHLESIYDVATALRAFAIVRERIADARLTVAGSGPERPALEELAQALHVARAVRFIGNVGPARVLELYRDADLMLNSSRVDNMPNALLEALACGVPIASTAAGGIPYMVEDGRTAMLAEVGNAQALAAAALRILEDPLLAQSLRANGLAAAQRYTWSSVSPRLREVYDRARARNGAGARAPAR